MKVLLWIGSHSKLAHLLNWQKDQSRVGRNIDAVERVVFRQVFIAIEVMLYIVGISLVGFLLFSILFVTILRSWFANYVTMHDWCFCIKLFSISFSFCLESLLLSVELFGRSSLDEESWLELYIAKELKISLRCQCVFSFFLFFLYEKEKLIVHIEYDDGIVSPKLRFSVPGLCAILVINYYWATVSFIQASSQIL